MPPVWHVSLHPPASPQVTDQVTCGQRWTLGLLHPLGCRAMLASARLSPASLSWDLKLQRNESISWASIDWYFFDIQRYPKINLNSHWVGLMEQ